jgi:redox-regulated HSP33 family molecular chaperone
VLGQHAYPAQVEALVAEATLLTALIGQTIKLRWKLSLQIRGNGAVRMIATDYFGPKAEGEPARLRAFASFDEGELQANVAPFDLIGDGVFGILIDQGPHMAPYKGITPLSGGTLAACAETYFAQSEQIPTRFALTFGQSNIDGDWRWRAGGMMIQHLPEASPFAAGPEPEAADGLLSAGDLVDGDDLENWQRVNILLDTARGEELAGPDIQPTDVLVRQHANALDALLRPAGVTTALLTGRETGASRRNLLKHLASGDIQAVVGTHALFQDDVAFRDLGLAVIDEQHRFGVDQRIALANKSPDSDVLVMTATPIPRTLVLSFYGDVGLSEIRQKPVGRKPIATRATPKSKLDQVIAAVGRAIADGDQIYWVCPLVSASDELDLTPAEERFESLKAHFGDKVGLVHGQMGNAEKDAAMQAFSTGQTRLLVATTVIEVGVDVPNATVIVIEHAERFGLAQLHQLRGRVGRGDKPSSCLLLYAEPLGQLARKRLDVMRKTEDGFFIAEEDLRLRGPGEVLGTRQSGTPSFRLADLSEHANLLSAARDDAKLMLSRDPDLQSPRGQALRLLLRWHDEATAEAYLRSG